MGIIGDINLSSAGDYLFHNLCSIERVIAEVERFGTIELTPEQVLFLSQLDDHQGSLAPEQLAYLKKMPNQMYNPTDLRSSNEAKKASYTLFIKQEYAASRLIA